MLTVKDVEQSLPPTLKTAATQSLVDKINNAVTDPVMAEHIRENFITYTKVLQDGRYKMEDYINAVKYVSFKLMNMTNQEAYFRTFPQRHAALVAKGTSSKDIASYVSIYHKGKLVNAILEQAMIPTWVLNQELYQKALNTQAELMANAASEMVRTQAANSILTHLAKPKEVGPLVNFDMRENSGMSDLKDTLRKLAEQQRDLIQAGVPTKVIAEQTIIDVEPK